MQAIVIQFSKQQLETLLGALEIAGKVQGLKSFRELSDLAEHISNAYQAYEVQQQAATNGQKKPATAKAKAKG